jgi:hypothetical protein
MTPKEKAEELIYQFAQRIPHSSYEAYENGVQLNFDLLNSKNCALLAVNLHLEELSKMKLIFSDREFHYKYWQEVKQEIEKEL